MAPRTKRRFVFSTRVLLLVITVLEILFAMFGHRMSRELQQRHATSEIQRLGGRFDYQHSTSQMTGGWSSRLMALLLYEDFTNVTGVSLDGTKIVDDDLVMLASLPKLEGLDISSTGITDAGVVHRTKIPNVKYINAHNTKLTDAGGCRTKTVSPFAARGLAMNDQGRNGDRF